MTSSQASPGAVAVLTVADAAPIDEAVEKLATIPGLTGDGRWQSLENVMPDGRVVLDRSDPPTAEQLTGEELVIAPPEAPNESISIDESPPEAPYQSYGAAASGRFVTWMTSTSTRLESWPWTLRAHNLKSGKTTELTRSPKIGGRDAPQVPGYTGPTIAGDRVYWAEVHGTLRRPQVDVMECRIENCHPSVVVQNSGLPTATNRALYVAQPVELGSSPPDQPFTVQRMDLRSGELTTIATLGRGRQAAPTGLAAGGTVVAWTHRKGNRGSITIHNIDTGEQVAVTSRADGIFGYPVATERFVAWAEASGNSPDQVGGYLYDLHDEQLYELGNTSGLYGITANGDIVTWQERTKPGAPASTVVARLR